MKVLPISLASGRRILVPALGVTLLAMMSASALAQLGTPNGRPGDGRAAQMPTDDTEKPAPLVDAIPGAKARVPAAPATKVLSDMPPTDALFDAINRGDIAAARDALSRGADLNGENVLGMTPMELSVDLGRNDISFLLLSMRGEDSGRGSRALAHDAKTAAAGKTAPKVKAVAGKSTGGRLSLMADAGGEGNAGPVPKLFANNGGSPVPSAGFLGFGSR